MVMFWLAVSLHPVNDLILWYKIVDARADDQCCLPPSPSHASGLTLLLLADFET